ncbi:hypothetical protein PhCBS80983_g02325 [Powellomyces hirtus]|uniref:Uncharacterized protein n=1 Tax=Powellomyces hirtus TaxID=109895 RepID=A0A507E7B8_9FUNG|nr:hypothetical protein PhCBS80983_g02325 [Powellomyces hirtus]
MHFCDQRPNACAAIHRLWRAVATVKKYALSSEAVWQSAETLNNLESELTQLEFEVLQEVWALLPDRAFNLWTGAGNRESDVNVDMDVVIYPKRYVLAYLNLARRFEARGFPLFNALPLRRRHIQAYTTIDTKLLRDVVLLKLHRKLSLKGQHHRLWGECFNLSHSAFHQRGRTVNQLRGQAKSSVPVRGMHQFDGTISTDGTGISVMLKSPLASKAGSGGPRKRMTKAMRKTELRRMYIDHPANLTRLQQADAAGSRRQIILIDPNNRDLLFMKEMHQPSVQGAGACRTMRYTSSQRANDTRERRTRRHQLFLRSRPAPYPPGFVGPQQRIEHIERESPSYATMNVNSFQDWLTWRADVDPLLSEFYAGASLRKSENWSLMKLNAFRLRQRSEDLLIQRMRAYFSPKLMVVLGDWQSEAGARHKKFHAPTKVAGFRTSSQSASLHGRGGSTFLKKSMVCLVAQNARLRRGRQVLAQGCHTF